MGSILIDTSIACAAGNKSEPDSPSYQCREFLSAITGSSLRLDFSASLHREWLSHKSEFTHGWLYGLHARKRIDMIELQDNHNLASRIPALFTVPAESASVQKDLHLLLGALGAGNRIASLDENARTLFSVAARQIAEIKELIWANPYIEKDAAIDWIKRNAPTERDRMLGNAV